MRRVVAAIAIFAGWLSIAVGAVAGTVVSEGFGINHTEGDIKPADVYGISGLEVLWIFVAAALLTSIPLLMAMFAVKPRRTLLICAACMGIPAIAMLPDDLGRAFGFPVVLGAGALLFAVRTLDKETESPEPAAEGVAESATDSAAQGATPTSTEATAASPSPISATADSPAETPAAPAARKSRKRAKGGQCPWCSADIPAGAATCSSCGATLGDSRSADAVPIPGLTEVSPGLRAYDARSKQKKRTSILKMVFSDDLPEMGVVPEPSDQAAILPPNAELRAEMARLDAEIAAGQAPQDPSDEEAEAAEQPAETDDTAATAPPKP